MTQYAIQLDFKRTFTFVILVILFALNFSFCAADLIYLKNGKIIEGKVKSSDENVLLIDTEGGTISVSSRMVDRVQRQTTSTEVIPYIIEVASQVRKEDSERALTYLLDQGFSSAHIVYEAPYYKVQVGPFTKEPEAIAAAKAIDKLPVPFASANKSQVIQGNENATAASLTVQSDIALAVNGAKASADSYQSGYPPSHVTDGDSMDPNDRWISKDVPGDHWLIIDFGEPKPFYRIEIYSGEEHDSRYILKNFTVQYWTGTEWSDLGTVKNNLVENPVFNFGTVTSQRIRIFITSANYIDHAARVFEVKVISEQQRQVSAQPTDQRIQYDFDIIEPAFLKNNNPEFSVKTGEWYTLPIKVSYEVGTISAFSLMITPDAEDFWTDINFRDYLSVTPEQYKSTVAFDTKNDPVSPTITGLGTLSFNIKSKAPLKPGRYPKILKCNLYNPQSLGVQKAREIPFTLVVE